MTADLFTYVPYIVPPNIAVSNQTDYASHLPQLRKCQEHSFDDPKNNWIGYTLVETVLIS